MKKLFVLVALVSVSSFCLCAETVQSLKSKICIVREVYFDETKEFCEKVSDSLNRKGYSDYSDYIDNYIGSTFGSGFLYVDKDGTNYVVTNRHVVSGCEGASVEFTNQDGSSSTFENLKVIATDENLDIAILAFANDERPFKSGITFAAKPAEDGEDVWSAGFPGLGGEPVWQFGRGNITNSSVKIKEFLDPSISTLIQHSAPVDSGNSGGPLLRKTGDSYEVIAINTWKFFYRQSANIALPASVVEKFIKDSLAKKNAFNSVQDLEARCASMKELFDSDDGVYFRDFSKYISYDYVKSTGVKAFDSEMTKGSKNTRTNITGAFVNYSPIEGLKYAVSSQVYKIFADDDFIKDAEIGEPSENEDGTYSIILTDQIKKVETVWVYEETGLTGVWRLSDVQNITKGKKGKKVKTVKEDGSVEVKESADIRIQSPYTVAFQWNMLPNADSKKNLDNQLSLAVTGKIVGLDLTYTHQNIYSNSMGFFGIALNLQVPVMINQTFAIVPYGKAGFGLSFESVVVYSQAGAKFAYRTNSDSPVALYGFAGWGSTVAVPDRSDPIKNSGLTFGFGIGL